MNITNLQLLTSNMPFLDLSRTYPYYSARRSCFKCVRFSFGKISEFKAMSILKEYLGYLHDALLKQTQDVGQVLLQILRMIEKNGRKSHRYEKKTVFDILGVTYEQGKVGIAT